ncbi:hypothetical protein GCM10009665_34030 [Kitasatospora nipponensis]|uniref:Small secreted domain DUF320 n=1 Tax=Kitasatospora nipponensis TaxID=258049 RepID=A0ABN1W8I4_9ACTN
MGYQKRSGRVVAALAGIGLAAVLGVFTAGGVVASGGAAHGKGVVTAGGSIGTGQSGVKEWNNTTSSWEPPKVQS